MIKLSWTAQLGNVDRQALWTSLLEKAENPLDYVPAITECRVVERYEDGFLREAIRNGEKLVQRVTPHAPDRIVFEHIGDLEVASITNIIGEDADGVTFTIEVELAAGGAARSLAESDFLHRTDTYFTGTIEAIASVLVPLAGATR